MSWASAVSRTKPAVRKPAGVFNPRPTAIYRPVIVPEAIDWARLVSLDFETYYDTEYTLSKLSTSEYVRDPRFEVLMVGIKVGNKPTRVVPGNKVAAELRKIPWATHSLLCHNTQFDGFILSHHYDIHPQRLYCTLSMARGLHSNEIGSGLDEVSVFYDGRGKVQGVLEELMKGIHFKELFANKKLWDSSTTYCAQDVEEMLHIFKQMVPKMPRVEMDLIHLTNRMFVQPVLKVDLPRVQKELDRELAERKALLMNALTPQQLRDIEADEAELKKILKTRAERSLTGEARVELITKRVVGSNERFADLLRAEGVEPPVKISPAWMKKPAAERFDEDKWAYAFAKDDLDFVNLPDNIEQLGEGLNLNKKADVEKLAARQQRLRSLVDVRLAVKSTSNITRAERFLRAGANGMPLPVGYAYARAHTLRWGGNNKMNMQNLQRGGELRQSILAPSGHVICVADSGQIEARVNGMLWGQDDLLEAFRVSDEYERRVSGMPKDKRPPPALHERDAYCRFGDDIYGRTITKADTMERFVGKVCVLGLGYQMGAPKLQITLARGALGGPPVFFELDRCKEIVNTYRRRNYRIAQGWEICAGIIEDMAAGREGSHGPICWEQDTIWLPNGMRLHYPDLKKAPGDKGWDEWTYQAKEMRKKIYGGLLCENLVQALARIIVAEQMLEIDTFAQVVMTTHDEVVAITRKAQAERVMARMIKTMQAPPKWWPNIPLNAEGGYAVNYSK